MEKTFCSPTLTFFRVKYEAELLDHKIINLIKEPIMTKLMEWLFGAFLMFGVWLAVIVSEANSSTTFKWYYKWFPVIFLILFGLHAALTVLYRVFTFNNCEAAAVQLQAEIKEARADLESKGIKFPKKAKS